jgi:capsular exopolysaccharide synthesis family protein
LLQLLRLRWPLIIGVALLPLIVAAVLISSLTPRYRAEAILAFDQRTNTVIDADPVLSKLSGDSNSVQSQLQILRSRTFLALVVDKARLEGDPAFSQPQSATPATDLVSTWWAALQSLSWFNSASATEPSEADVKDTVAEVLLNADVSFPAPVVSAGGGTFKEAIVDRLLVGLAVSQVGFSSAMRIQFTSENPQQAAQLANAIADTYIEDLLNVRFQATETASNFLSNRLTQLRAEAQATENAVSQFRANNPFAESGQGGSTIDQQLAALTSQLVAARLDLSEQTGKVDRIRELLSVGRNADVAQVITSPLIAQLRADESELQRQEAELSTRYGPRHPRIIDLQSQKADLQRKVAEEVGRITETASASLEMARSKVTALEESVDRLQRSSSERGQSLVTLRQLEQRAESASKLYEAAQQRFEQVEDREQVQRPDARVLSYAAVPVVPSFPPNKMLMFGVAIPGSLFLGFFAALFKEMLVSGFRTSAQLERALALPVLGMAPEVTGRKAKSVTNIINDNPCSSFAEAIRGIQLGLSLPDADHPPRVVLVTSAMPREGKSTVALSLARSAARDGKKVVLIDCDLRRPKVLTMAKAGRIKKGLVHALLGRETLENCLYKDPGSDVLLLAPETGTDNPGLLLGSVEREKLIQQLRGIADLVIIDSAPLLPVNDTKLLIRLIDTMLLIVQWEKTPRNAAIAAARSLFDLHAPIAGVVVTRGDPRQYYAYTYGLKNYSNYVQYYRD